jgi:hypothetical protein
MGGSTIEPVGRLSRSGEVSGTVLLDLRCFRRRHLILRVVDAGAGGLLIEAPRYSAGLTKSTWVAASFSLRRGSGRRYGCACGPSVLLADAQLAEAIASGVRTWIVC